MGEPVEDVGQELRTNALAVIGDRDLDCLARLPDADVDASAPAQRGLRHRYAAQAPTRTPTPQL